MLDDDLTFHPIAWLPLLGYLAISGVVQVYAYRAARDRGGRDSQGRFVEGQLPSSDEIYIAGYVRDGAHAVALLMLVKALAGGYVAQAAANHWQVVKKPGPGDALLLRFVSFSAAQSNTPGQLWRLATMVASAAERQISELAEGHGLVRGPALANAAQMRVTGAMVGLVLVGMVLMFSLTSPESRIVGVALYPALGGNIAVAQVLARRLRPGEPTAKARAYLSWLEGATSGLRDAISNGRAGGETEIALAVAGGGGSFLMVAPFWSSFREHLPDQPRTRSAKRDDGGDGDSGGDGDGGGDGD